MQAHVVRELEPREYHMHLVTLCRPRALNRPMLCLKPASVLEGAQGGSSGRARAALDTGAVLATVLMRDKMLFPLLQHVHKLGLDR